MVIMLRNGINCIKFYWFGIFCSSIMGIVVSTFLDYKVLFSKGDFYTWRVSFTIFVISVTVSDIIMLHVTALSRFLYLRIRYSIKCPLCIFPLHLLQEFFTWTLTTIIDIICLLEIPILPVLECRYLWEFIIISKHERQVFTKWIKPAYKCYSAYCSEYFCLHS